MTARRAYASRAPNVYGADEVMSGPAVSVWPADDLPCSSAINSACSRRTTYSWRLTMAARSKRSAVL